jgi:hypothetical protein
LYKSKKQKTLPGAGFFKKNVGMARFELATFPP